jgi:hypothetical protein
VNFDADVKRYPMDLNIAKIGGAVGVMGSIAGAFLFIAKQPDAPSRPEAIRRVLDSALPMKKAKR